ncbi:MAG: hypothetical protein K6E34_02185 [Lachnospiraceae bacterium]|nr:hypothetical protein [Lachnospiraceae bacterium]
MKEIEWKLRRILCKLEGKKIYAMGSQGNIEGLNIILNKRGFSICGILDNNISDIKLDSTIPTYSPEDILKPYNNKIAVLIYSSGYWREMRSQLKGMGYGSGQVYVLNYRDPENRERNNALRGESIYRRLVKKAGDDFEIILLRGATGDVYLNGLFLKRYVANRNNRKHLIVGDAKGVHKILKLFDMDNDDVISLDTEDTTDLERYGILCGMDELHIKETFYWHYSLYFNRCRIRLSRKFNFMDTYKYMIYPGVERLDRAPGFLHEIDVDREFYDRGLIPGKTVMLSPVAYSVKELPIFFWKEIAERLKDKGYSLCANLSDDEKERYDFLTAVFIPFELSLAFLETAGYLIALRSGFCDIVSTARCKKIILYPAEKPKRDDSVHRCDLAFSGLNNMGLCDDAIEIESDAIDDILLDASFIIPEDREDKLKKLADDVISYIVSC